VFGIWWLYFTDVPASGLSERHGRRMAWVYLHFPMHLSLVAAAVALAHTLVAEADETDPGQFEFGSIQYIVIPVAAILLAIGLIGLVGGTPRELARQRLRVFLWAAAALVIAEAVLLGVDSYDLETSTVIVAVVLALTARSIRRIGAAPEPVPDAGT